MTPFTQTDLFSQVSDLEDESESTSDEKKPLSVYDLTLQIKSALEPKFNSVWVQGEISNYKPASSGHVYFSLKDDKAVVSAAFFGWAARSKQVKFKLEDGLQVLCRGKISVYAPRGNYQLVLDQIEPVGAGALQLAFEQLKEKLKLEGLFDQTKKKPLPKFPKRIAVITSPGGAVIRDMMNVLRRRAPQIEVVVIPALVQGETASPQLIRGLDLAEKAGIFDLVVLARGGGSMEDLWAFNDETLARRIARCKLPTISAVGHEVDFTICDFVSDLRAPTPSAAAEILSGHWVDCVRFLTESKSRLETLIRRDLVQRKSLFEQLKARLKSPKDQLREQSQRCDDFTLRLAQAMKRILEQSQARLRDQSGRLNAMSPLAVLDRGYTLVLSEKGELIKTANVLSSGDQVKLKWKDGIREAQIK